MKRLKKNDWQIALESISPVEMVTVWIQPKGVAIKTVDVDGTATLVNGAVTLVNTKLAKLMIEAGIEGTSIITTTNLPTSSIPSWLTWWLSTDRDMSDESICAPVEIFTYGIVPNKELPVKVTPMTSITMKAGDVLGEIHKISEDESVDLINVARDNGEIYGFEPTRSIKGKVVKLTPNGILIDYGKGMPLSVVSRCVDGIRTAAIKEPAFGQYIAGKEILVQYTQRLECDRLKNYRSEVIVEIADEVTEEPIIGSYHRACRLYGVPDQPKALLNVASIGRATVERTAFGDVILRDYDGTVFMTLQQKVPVDGDYVALLSNEWGKEVMVVDAKQDISAVTISSLCIFLTSVVEPELGLVADDVGIYYEMGGLTYIGKDRL